MKKSLNIVSAFATAAILTTDLTAQIAVSGGAYALSSAVAAYPNETTFVVAPGIYDGVTAFNRDLTIIAPQRATIFGGVTVTDSLGQSRLRVLGLDLQSIGPTGPAMILCTGDLVVEDCTCERIRCSNGTFGTGQVDVRIADTTVTSTVIALQLADCNAVVQDSTFLGGAVGNSWTAGAPAIQCYGTLLRAERVTAIGSDSSSNPGWALTLSATLGSSDSRAWFADSTLSSAPPTPFWTNYATLVGAGSILTLSPNTVVTGVQDGPTLIAPLATATWATRNWMPGATSVITLQDEPATIGATLVTWEHELFETPLVAEPLFVGSTPNWIAWSFGVSNSQGDLDTTIALPNDSTLLYRDVRATGLFVTASQWRSTAPLGGIIR